MGLRQFLVDAWGWLNFKPVYSDPVTGGPNRRAFPAAHATWVPEEDARRLAAYTVLAAYDNNQAGELAEVRDGVAARERREYGDPANFIDAITADVLGDEQRIVVAGAEHDDTGPEADEARIVQETLLQWAEDEQFAMRMQQAERKAVSLGDAVYRLSWEASKGRPVVRAIDPGFYFPVLDDDGGEFPRRVHFAWELPEDTRRGLKPRLRRITYELAPIAPATVSSTDRYGRPDRTFLGEPDAPLLTPGDLVSEDGTTILRQYPWNDAPSPYTCYLTDAMWLLEDLERTSDVDNLPMDKATYAQRDDGQVLKALDLMIDFVPVIHLPNTVPGAEEHWGRPSLARVLQIMDELAASDTDAAKASATTGTPIISVSGLQDTRANLQAAPGMVFKLTDGGRMDVLNTAPQLAQLLSTVETLRERAAVNLRLPAVALGTHDPAQMPSGYALQLSLGPLDKLISGMRLARRHKYQLLLRFVQRLFIAGQAPGWVGRKVHDASVVFGAYAPTDRAAVLEEVTTAYAAGVISLETALRMLVESGWPIDDIPAEIERIQARAFESAGFLADATGDPQAVRDYLGLGPAPTDQPPAPVLPDGRAEEDADDDAAQQQ
ncbi:hypothetical protein [Streptomyces ipomoeae]|uniref:hypothetical protein n=1 Tax=Streptomyces ipomoeae TaxID=103232 RepID=UPI00114704BD|nr:hypothetical protein [Streptomyces ipomoeae]TQE33054.1 hypothetical protein Sipo7851_21360 [Streptomyces ipomoeae]